MVFLHNLSNFFIYFASAMGLMAVYLAIYLRIMRASMLEVLTLDFVRSARAKGLSEYAVLVRHVWGIY